MSLYWLRYVCAKGVVGAAVFEAQLPVEAKLKAYRAGLGVGFAVKELDENADRLIPKTMIGRPLEADELQGLQLKLMAKKPAAASVRRRDPRKRSAS